VTHGAPPRIVPVGAHAEVPPGMRIMSAGLERKLAPMIGLEDLLNTKRIDTEPEV